MAEWIRRLSSEQVYAGSSPAVRAFEYDSVAQMEPERRSTKAKAASSSLAGVTERFVGLVGYDSGPVNRQRWFESSTKLLNV